MVDGHALYLLLVGVTENGVLVIESKYSATKKVTLRQGRSVIGTGDLRGGSRGSVEIAGDYVKWFILLFAGLVS